MINVNIGNNMKRTNVIVDENSTLREVLTANDIDYSMGQTQLDGATLQAGDLDKTFADFGITEKCFLRNIVKMDNAVA